VTIYGYKWRLIWTEIQSEKDTSLPSLGQWSGLSYRPESENSVYDQE